jgi:Trypsin-like peptidase domain
VTRAALPSRPGAVKSGPPASRPGARRRSRLALLRITRGGAFRLALVLAAAAAAGAGALALAGDPARSRLAASDAGRIPPHLRPLRVTSGHEIATGFFAGGDRIVTVAHVLDGRVAVNGGHLRVSRVLRGQGEEVVSVPARVLRVDRRSDLALLAAPDLAGSGLVGPGPAARGLATEPARSGASVRVLRLRNGRPSSLSVQVRRAIVAHVRGPGAARPVTRPALELAARVAAGDSGAPVVFRSGALAGVVFATSSAREETAYAVDASAVRRLLAQH